MNGRHGSELTESQKREVSGLLQAVQAVRSTQAGAMFLGFYVWLIEGRPVIAFFICLACAAWLQTRLPVLPAWLENIRKRNI